MRAAVAFVLASIVCLLLALLLSLVARGGRPLPGDLAIAGWLQSWGGAPLDALAAALSALGRTLPMTLIALACAAWLAGTERRAAAVVVVAAATLRALSLPLKSAVARPRPTPDLVMVLERASGAGFPSGHTLGATLLCVVLAGVLPLSGRFGWAARALLLALPWVMGWARVRVGAHWPSDVLAGLLWGGGAALALLAVLRMAAPAESTALDAAASAQSAGESPQSG
ncbi:MAG: phosphatase PAP2 family protein [Thermomicrobiales bacterium]|nr:phosphatase PAP2 family protein [Thermomicrobiales bacterium]